MNRFYPIFLLTFLFLLGGGVAQAQQAQTISAAGADCTTTQACAVYNIGSNAATATINIAGNAGANTLQFEICSGSQPTPCAANGSDWVAVNAFPPNSSTAVTSTTSTGTWSINVAGYVQVRVRCSAFVSGTAKVSANLSNAVAAATLIGGGGGAGGVTAAGSFPITGTSNVLFDLQLNAGSGTALADSSGNGLRFTIGTCSSGSVAWGAAPQYGLTFTAGRNCVTSNSPIPTTLHAIEVTYCAGPFTNNPIPGSNAATQQEMIYFSTSLEGPEMVFSAQGQGGARLPEQISETTWAPNGSTGSASNPVGCHMNTFVLDATHDLFFQDNVRLQDFESNSPTNSAASYPLTASYTMVLGGGDASGGLGSPGIFDGTIYRIRGLAVEPTTGFNGTQVGEYAAMNFAMQQRGVTLGNGITYSSPVNKAFTIGDSLLNGTSIPAAPSNFYSAIGGWDYTNNAIVSTYASGAAGACPSDAIANVNPLAINVPVVGWGHNDMSIGLGANVAVNYVMRIVQCLHQAGVQIPVITSYMTTAGLSGQQDLTREFANDILRQLAVPQGFVLADLGSDTRMGIQGGFSNATYFQSADQVHPTIAGAEIMGTIIGRNITRAAALQRPVTTPNTFKVGNALPITVENFTYCNDFVTAPLTCGGTVTVPTITYNQPVNPGDATCIVAGQGFNTLTGITDTAGGTWAQLTTVSWSGVFTSLWCAPNSAGANSDVVTVTFNVSQGNLLNLTAFVIRGAATASILDTSQSSSGTSTTPTTSSLTTGNANEEVCALLATSGVYANLTTATSVGYEMLTNQVPNTAGNVWLQCQFVPASGTVVLSANSTLTPSSNWAMTTFAIKPGVFPTTWGLRETDGLSVNNPFILDSSGGAITAQLTDAVGIVGQHTYLRTLNSPNAITLAPKIGSGETINGAANMPLQPNSSYDCISIFAGNVTAGANWNCTITVSSPTQLITFLADWTCGTGGTVSSCVAATILGSTVTPMTFTLPLQTNSVDLDCDGVVSSTTGTPANNWNLLTATNGATNTTASYSMGTAAAVGAFGATTDQASTTTTFSIGGTWTLGAAATKFPFHIHARIEGASASGTVLSVQIVDPTVADLLTIYRGTTCRIK